MKNNLVVLLLAVTVALLTYGCNSGSTAAYAVQNYGPYTTSNYLDINPIPHLGYGSIYTDEDNLAIEVTGNAYFGLGVSFSSVSPQAYFSYSILSPFSTSAITITSIGSNCGSSPSSAPVCTYIVRCVRNGTGEFYLQLNGPAGAANLHNKPIKVICSVF